MNKGDDRTCRMPGISHHEPGGLTTRELIRVIQNFRGKLVAADIVEYNPYRDIQNVTAMVAAKLMKEIRNNTFVKISYFP